MSVLKLLDGKGVEPDLQVDMKEHVSRERDADKRIAQCGFLLGRYPHMKILALAPEQNRGLFYWAIVDVRTKPLESSEAGILNALREPPSLVGTVQN